MLRRVGTSRRTSFNVGVCRVNSSCSGSWTGTCSKRGPRLGSPWPRRCSRALCARRHWHRREWIHAIVPAPLGARVLPSAEQPGAICEDPRASIARHLRRGGQAPVHRLHRRVRRRALRPEYAAATYGAAAIAPGEPSNRCSPACAPLPRHRVRPGPPGASANAVAAGSPRRGSGTCASSPDLAGLVGARAVRQSATARSARSEAGNARCWSRSGSRSRAVLWAAITKLPDMNGVRRRTWPLPRPSRRLGPLRGGQPSWAIEMVAGSLS